MGTIHLLTNPKARGGRRPRAGLTIAAALRARGHEIRELEPQGPEEINDILNQAKAGGMSHLVLGGGDGLIHHCLPALAGSGVTLGIVPVGTGNDFARALGLPRRLPKAIEAALAPPTPIDLIATDSGRFAATVVTGGFSGQVNARANHLRFPPGQQRYTAATLLELRHLTPQIIKLDIDGTVTEHETTLFAIANTRYFGGGMAICPHARPDDGQLELTLVGPVSRLELARVLPAVFSGRHLRHPAVHTRRGRVVGITAATPLWADGEPFQATTLRAAPGVLKVAGTLIPS